jgi:RNA polymerase sigma factor (sigma-70 family)
MGAYEDDRGRRWAAVEPHRERLLRIARARLDDPHDAEDCVQEALLRCVEFAGLDEERVGQFLTTVTVRLTADVHRGRARRDRLARRLTAFEAHEPGPEEPVCDRAESAWLSRVLDGLSPRQRAIVDARAEGLSCRAVAERLLVPYTTVESSLARVRRSLRGALESTLGVAAVRPHTWWRDPAAATATAAVVGLGAVLHPALPAAGTAPGDVRREVAVAATSASGATAPGTRAPARTTAAPDRVAGERRTAAAALRPVRSLLRPTDHDRPAIVVDAGGIGAGGGVDDEYTFSEVVDQCVRYGVGVGERVDCRYPPGHARRERRETAGTPDPSEVIR